MAHKKSATVADATGYGLESGPMKPTDRVRRRIREILEERQWKQSEWAEAVGHTQPWVSQLLKGHTDPQLDELDHLALSLGTNAVELVRDPEQFQFCADLTPSELAAVRQIRKLSPPVRDALWLILQAIASTRSGIPQESARERQALQASAGHLEQLVREFRALVSTALTAERKKVVRRATRIGPSSATNRKPEPDPT